MNSVKLQAKTNSKNYWKGTVNMFQQLIKYKGMRRILLKRHYGDKHYSIEFIRSEMLRTNDMITPLEQKIEEELGVIKNRVRIINESLQKCHKYQEETNCINPCKWGKIGGNEPSCN